MKELLARIKDVTLHRALSADKDIWYILEYDTEDGHIGVVITYRSPNIGVQNGLTRDEFLTVYPEFESTLPADPHVISFLEFASIEDFEQGELEKAYVVYTADATFEGITGYPISVKRDLQKDVQVAVPVTDTNLIKIPSEVLDQIPQTSDLAYIRYNKALSRISYEREYSVTANDEIPHIDGVDRETLSRYITNIREHLGIDTVRFMVKHTVGKPTPKLYFALSYCEDCQDSA